MAQVILSAAGRVIGGALGGAIGRVIGHAIDRTAINSLTPARQSGRIAGLKLSGSAQGDPVAQIFGRARVAGTVIWAARLKEHRDRTRASKTAPASEQFSYALSFAIALCDGPIDGIGRLWADGQLLDQSRVSYRLYTGDEAQMPDALIAAIEGSAPAYRGTAYTVFEDFDLTPFGNRPPSISVEVFRRPRGPYGDLESKIEGVCLIPGAGEFVYATEPNAVLSGLTRATWETQHTGDGRTDFVVSLDQMAAALPNLKRVNLVVAWFGTSSDIGDCLIRPGVESRVRRTSPLDWSVGGYTRDTAHLITQVDGRPVYGGTPSDATVIAAIAELKARAYEVTLVPFLLMDCEGFPWRGRLTGSVANLATFVGAWGAFVRHTANLAIEADCVLLGSELRGLTTLRDEAGGYPFVAALRDLAAEVRAILPHAKISYGADWSEYFGHHSEAGVWFHLDPLWADANIDFVGIDWYAPLTDWRDEGGLDAAVAASIYDPAYLTSRVAGGEDYDWYYASDADRAAQVRTPITDGGYGEPWVFRAKALREWWANAHHNRPGWVRDAAPTEWVPQSKPVRLLEIGCGAVDKGPNAPNLFLDPKSSESALPPYSSGARDDRAQRAYLTAFADYYAAHNPISTIYGAPMLSGMDVWCWDARPYPAFPGRGDVWGDSENWRTGHWLNGRMGGGEARNLIADIAAQAGTEIDVSEVGGGIDGYVVEQPMTALEALAPVLDYLGLTLCERGAGIGLVGAGHGLDLSIGFGDLAWNDDLPVLARRDLISVPAQLTLRCYDPDRDYQLQSVTVRREGGADQVAIDAPLLLSHAQAVDYAQGRLAALARVRQTVTLDIDPLLSLRLEPGDGVTVPGETGVWRVVAIDRDETPTVTVEPVPLARAVVAADPSQSKAVVAVVAPSIVTGFRLVELPCLSDSDVRPVLAPSADPWRGVDVYAGAGPDTLRRRGRVAQVVGIGRTLHALPTQRPGYLLRQASLDIRLEGLAPVSVSEAALLGGDNFVCVKAQNGEWEIVQALGVTLTGADTYRLTGLVRGQWGSEQALAAGIAVDAEVVWLSHGFARADVAMDEVGLSRLWRTGLTGFGGAAAGSVDVTATWTGLALRPRAPVHGRWIGDVLTWLRSPRYGGDSWDTEPPLCEDYERYRVRVFDGPDLVREDEVDAPSWVFTGRFPGARIEVAQKSQVWGYGPVLVVGA